MRDLEVHHGDILVTKAGPRDRVGVVVHVNTHPKRLIVSGKMVGLRPRTDVVLPQVLAGVLGLRQPQDYIHARTTGMAESQVNFANKVLLETKVRIPDMIEQSRIAAVLDTVNEAIAKTEALIAKLKQVRAGMLHDLFTRGLDENGDLRDPERFQDSPLGRIPRDWRISTLGAELPLQRGFDITVAQQREGEVPVVSSSGITSYHDTAMVAGPGVVTGRKGKLGGVFYIDRDFWPHDTSLWVTDFHGNSAKFAALCLGQMRLERFDAATSVPTLNRNTIHPLHLALPSRSEQERIVSAVEDWDKFLATECKWLDKLGKIKSGLMADLLAGRVRVPEAISIVENQS
jgi:type I restriction enzyme, S subunit